MRFLTIFRPSASATPGPPAGARGEAMRRYSEEQSRAGALISQAMLDSALTEVRFDGAAFQSEERIDPVAGYAFVEAASHAEAVEGVKAFMQVAGPGATELRRVLV